MIRLEEHCRDVRNKVIGTLDQVPPLDEWQSRSEPLFHTLRDDAKAASRAHKAMRKGIKGKSTAGMARRSPHGVDADGRSAKYKRSHNGHYEHGGVGAPPSLAHRYAQEQAYPGAVQYLGGGGAHYPAGFTPDKKRKRQEEMVCLRCNRKGHRMNECRFAGWCPIKRD